MTSALRNPAVLLAAAIAASCVSAPQAVATAADCSGGRNGFVGIRDDLSGTSRAAFPLASGTVVSLETGRVADANRVWAHLSGGANHRDKVWMDWSRDGGRTWLQCGPFEVRYDGGDMTSAAHTYRNDRSWLFRACGFPEGADRGGCTAWWPS